MQENQPLHQNSEKKTNAKKWKRLLLNKYSLAFFVFLIWMIFFDSASFLVIKDLNDEIQKYEEKVKYYRTEYEKNTEYYNRLMNNKDEKEKFARENYFMKRPNEEIFIIVSDTTKIGK